MVEMHLDFGLGATGPRLLAPPGPFEALAGTGPTVKKWLIEVRAGSRHLEALGKIHVGGPPQHLTFVFIHFILKCVYYLHMYILITL